jgi:B-box zinc finger
MNVGPQRVSSEGDSRMSTESIRCPVCGGAVKLGPSDKVNRCEFCGSPVLGRSQKRDCVNHPGRLAVAVCNVCGDLICEECTQRRIGDYGGKLFTITNCLKEQCVAESSWAQKVNPDYQRLTNMDWADSVDNAVLHVAGLGAVIMMVFELIFILAMLYIQFFTSWGLNRANVPYFFIRGDAVIILGILGNLVSAILLQTSLQVYIHERQLGAGIVLLGLLVIEVILLLERGLFFNLRYYPSPYLLIILLAAFGSASLLVFIGAAVAIAVGSEKRGQLKEARKILGLNKK